MNIEPGVAIAGTAVALAAASVTRFAVTAQQAVTSTPIDTFLSGGVAAGSVAALVYVAKQFADGKLMSRPLQDQDEFKDRTIATLIEANSRLSALTENIIAVAKEGHAREIEHVRLLDRHHREAE